jgi:hypothetical protein
MTEFELMRYGMSQADIRDQYINSISAKLVGVEMAIMGILSDCQEMMARKNPTILSPNTDKFIRQQLNIAKFIIAEQLQAKKKAA